MPAQYYILRHVQYPLVMPITTMLRITTTMLETAVTPRAGLTHVLTMTDAFKGMRPLFNLGAMASV
jgi:hypothetical protein